MNASRIGAAGGAAEAEGVDVRRVRRHRQGDRDAVGSRPDARAAVVDAVVLGDRGKPGGLRDRLPERLQRGDAGRVVEGEGDDLRRREDRTAVVRHRGQRAVRGLDEGRARVERRAVGPEDAAAVHGRFRGRFAGRRAGVQSHAGVDAAVGHDAGVARARVGRLVVRRAARGGRPERRQEDQSEQRQAAMAHGGTLRSGRLRGGMTPTRDASGNKGARARTCAGTIWIPARRPFPGRSGGSRGGARSPCCYWRPQGPRGMLSTGSITRRRATVRRP